MRFVLGVFIGAVMTLCVATVFDGPTRALVARGGAFLGDDNSAWNRFFLSTGKAVFPITEAREPMPVTVPFQAQPESATEPLSALAEQAEQTEQAEQPREPAGQDDDAITGEATDHSPAMEPLPESPSPSRVATHEELVPAQDGTEIVWVPFRSQMSARGFAARLAAQTQHPFAVTRQGPGRYQVYYAYANEAQREQLAQRIRAATGEAMQ